MYYDCFRCNKYTTLKKSNIANHLHKKNKCIPDQIMNIIDLTDNEILEKSLIPKYIKNNNQIIDHKCNLCNKKFKTEKTLFFYSNNNCKLKDISEIKNVPEIKKSDEDNTKIYNIETQNKIENKIETQIINNFINPTFNFNLIGFDQDWNLDHINESDKKIISFCHFKYTTLLKEILDNYVNLNVFIDKKTEQGYVYNNITKNFEKKDRQKIVDDTIDKLYKHLIDINDEIKIDNNFYLDRKILNLVDL